MAPGCKARLVAVCQVWREQGWKNTASQAKRVRASAFISHCTACYRGRVIVRHKLGEPLQTAKVAKVLMTRRPALNRVDVIGISVYSSKDLLNWQNEGAYQLLLYATLSIYRAGLQLAQGSTATTSSCRQRPCLHVPQN